MQWRKKSSRTKQMKLFKIIAIVIVGGIFGVILVCVALHIVVNQHSEITESQIAAIFEKVGGANKVNQEAKDIFTQFGTSEITFDQKKPEQFPLYFGVRKICCLISREY